MRRVFKRSPERKVFKNRKSKPNRKKRKIFKKSDKEPLDGKEGWFFCKQAGHQVRDSVCIHRLNSYNKLENWKGCYMCSTAINFEHEKKRRIEMSKKRFIKRRS